MALMPISSPPGVCKSVSDYASGKEFAYSSSGSASRMASGRFTDMDHARFVAGFPEKIGGWVAVNGWTTAVGKPRAEQSWRDNTGNPRLAVGTESHLYSWDGSTQLDITPMQPALSIGTLGANPFTTSTNSTTVAVADTSSLVKNGDWVKFSGATTFNNVTINGWYIASSASGTGYNITAATTANNNGSGGGASVVYNYPRVNLSNPFTTTLNSAVVKVTHTSHGQMAGNYVDFSGASAVGGLTINGEYQITSVIDANNYNITASSQASSGASGGGTVSTFYLIELGTQVVSLPTTYGTGAYGAGPYGYAQSSTATTVPGWTLARYGSILVACPIGGTIYFYETSQGGRAHPLLNAPNDVEAMFVTPERFIVALGDASSPMQIAWCDQNDPTQWTTTSTNTANTGRTFEGGTKFVGGSPVRHGVSLAVTDKAMFEMSYSGDAFIYDTPEGGDNCDLVSANAITAFGEVAYWMGSSEFWMWNGTVTAMPSDDIRDYVYRNINSAYLSKCWVRPLRAKKEIWFSYPSASSTEIDSYVIYHTDQNAWSIGTWSGLAGSAARTAWQDADLFTVPFASDVNGVLYQHETGTDDNGSPLNAYVTFAPVDVSNGDANVDVMGFLPDLSRLSQNGNLLINSRYYPQDSNTVSGPFQITATDTTPYVDLRIDGKMVGFEFNSDVLGGDFRLGLCRLNVQAAGARI